ncbi:MAG: 16S rRNA (cytosine(1402)-N(4))-methyltransferase, partial [Alphaproteobacteria bacterium]
LADLIRGVVRKSKDGIDPATRTFQALRIFVNDELGELARGLAGAEALLAPGGRLAVVSFHSLEDRAVKEFLRERSGAGPRPSRHLPDLPVSTHKPTFTLITRGTVKPGQAETRSNPRARSARLRWAVRTDAPARAAA